MTINEVITKYELQTMQFIGKEYNAFAKSLLKQENSLKVNGLDNVESLKSSDYVIISNPCINKLRGAAKICIENNVPYVPVAILDKAITIGRPVYLKKIIADYDDYNIMAIDMRDQLRELMNGRFDFFPGIYEA